MSWYVDRSRYLDGFNCPWKRLLKFHAFGTGIERSATYSPLQTGIAVHSALEGVLKMATVRNRNLDQADVNALLSKPIADYRAKIQAENFEDPGDILEQQLALVEALAHGFTRISLPWVRQQFTIRAIEEELTVELAPGLNWMARPDFVTINQQTGLGAVHDFKTAAYWSDSDTNEWADNVQMMLNAYCCTRVYGQPFEHYYIHVLKKGSKKSPSYLTHPSVANGVLLPYYQRSAVRTFINGIAGVSLDDWVWKMPEQYLAQNIIVIGPFAVDQRKVNRLIAGIARNEQLWQHHLNAIPSWEKWDDPGFQRYLDTIFPRTFNCYEFGGRRCQFYDICHYGTSWQDPIGTKHYHPRQPHHSQEIVGE